MDPRISARRTAVIRAQGRRRLLLLIIGLAGTALLVGAWFLLHSPVFGARAVTVSGNTHETAAQVITQAGLAGEPPLIDVDAGAAATRIEQLPWVRGATVNVSWPDGVHITVTEETPRLEVDHARWSVGDAEHRRARARGVGDASARSRLADRPAAAGRSRIGAARQ